MFSFTENLQPLEQFQIVPVFILKNLPLITFIFSNFFIYSFFSLLTIFIFFKLNVFSFKLLISPTWQSLIENSYIFILDILQQQVGRLGKKYFVLFFSVFIFILSSNLIGLIPYSFTTTSHIAQTFTFSFSIFLGLTLLGFVTQKFEFLNLFVPKGVPVFLLPFLVIIEVISYISRTFSLAIRLFANMMSGHTLLNILSSFGVTLYNKCSFFEKILAFAPIFIVLIILVLEFCIAFLQAYVFVVLLCIYLNDSFHAAH